MISNAWRRLSQRSITTTTRFYHTSSPTFLINQQVAQQEAERKRLLRVIRQNSKIGNVKETLKAIDQFKDEKPTKTQLKKAFEQILEVNTNIDDRHKVYEYARDHDLLSANILSQMLLHTTGNMSETEFRSWMISILNLMPPKHVLPAINSAILHYAWAADAERCDIIHSVLSEHNISVNPEYHSEMVLALIRNGLVDRGIELMKEGVKRNLYFDSSLLKLIAQLFAEKDWHSAFQLLDIFGTTDDCINCLIDQAVRIATEEDQINRSHEFIKQILEKDIVLHKDSFSQIIHFYARQRSVEEARKWFDTAVKSATTYDVTQLLALLHCYEQINSRTEAIQLVIHVKKLGMGTSRAILDLWTSTDEGFTSWVSDLIKAIQVNDEIKSIMYPSMLENARKGAVNRVNIIHQSLCKYNIPLSPFEYQHLIDTLQPVNKVFANKLLDYATSIKIL